MKNIIFFLIVFLFSACAVDPPISYPTQLYGKLQDTFVKVDAIVVIAEGDTTNVWTDFFSDYEYALIGTNTYYHAEVNGHIKEIDSTHTVYYLMKFE